MKKREILLSVALLVAIILGMFVYTYIAQQKMDPAPVVEAPVEDIGQAPFGITQIDATHFYIDGTHTIVGEIMMPTPCDLLTYTAGVAESMPEQITYTFDVINTSEMCAQVITPQRFRVDAVASDQALHRATLMGVEVELNLREAGPLETPDDFEVYQKG